MYKIVNSSLVLMSAQLNDYNDYNKIKNRCFHIVTQQFMLKKALNEIIRSYKMQAETKAKKFTVHWHDYLPKSVLCDKMRLQQVLRNLISNALYYASSTVVVEIAFSYEKKQLRVAVTDDGIGIPNETFFEIFKPFKQLRENLM